MQEVNETAAAIQMSKDSKQTRERFIQHVFNQFKTVKKAFTAWKTDETSYIMP
jgi:hypothetical protein